MSNNQWQGPYGSPNPMSNGPQGGQPGYQQGGAQQPWTQGHPQGGAQPGYPQGGQPGYQQGGAQQPWTQGHPQGGTQPGYPQGGTQQLWNQAPAAYGAAGYGAPGHGAPPPPTKPRTNPLLIALIVVLVLLIGAGGVYLYLSQSKTPQAGPTTTQPQPTSSEPTGEPTSTEPTQKHSSSEPTTSEPTNTKNSDLPAFPESFGEFSTREPTETVAFYNTPSFDKSFIVLHFENADASSVANELEETQTDGDITCGVSNLASQKSVMCITPTSSGALNSSLTINGQDATPAEALAVTKEFMAVWK